MVQAQAGTEPERGQGSVVVERMETEVAAFLAALGALLTVLSAGLSVLWFGRWRRACFQSGRVVGPAARITLRGAGRATPVAPK